MCYLFLNPEPVAFTAYKEVWIMALVPPWTSSSAGVAARKVSAEPRAGAPDLPDRRLTWFYFVAFVIWSIAAVCFMFIVMCTFTV